MKDPNAFRNDAAKLTNAEWAALDKIAASVGAFATTGPTAGQPSWRRMLKDIANGELIIMRPTIYTHIYTAEEWGNQPFLINEVDFDAVKQSLADVDMDVSDFTLDSAFTPVGEEFADDFEDGPTALLHYNREGDYTPYDPYLWQSHRNASGEIVGVSCK